MHVAKPHAVHGEEVQGYAQPRKFQKWFVLVYILIRFFHKIFPKTPFFIQKLMILLAHLLWGIKLPEKF